MSQVFDARVTLIFGGYQKKADNLIEAIKKTAAELFDVPYNAVSPAGIFKMNYLPYWITERITFIMNPLPKNIVNRMMPVKIRKAKITKEYLAEAEALVLHNVENLRWATLQNLKQAFWKFSADLEARLEEIIFLTHGAIKSTYEKRQIESQTFSEGVDKVKVNIDSLKVVQEKLKKKF